ncbi:MAG TPA: DUF4190 domain-containing protein [Microlunatus sp.]
MSYDQAPPPPGGGNPYGAPQYGGPPAQDPGRTMGIVGLVLSIVGFFCGVGAIAGIIVSAIALNKSKAAGFKNNLALAGLIIGIVSLVLGVIVGITYTLPMFQQMGG